MVPNKGVHSLTAHRVALATLCRGRPMVLWHLQGPALVPLVNLEGSVQLASRFGSETVVWKLMEKDRRVWPLGKAESATETAELPLRGIG